MTTQDDYLELIKTIGNDASKMITADTSLPDAIRALSDISEKAKSIQAGNPFVDINGLWVRITSFEGRSITVPEFIELCNDYNVDPQSALARIALYALKGKMISTMGVDIYKIEVNQALG